jgi:hypothetical protein
MERRTTCALCGAPFAHVEGYCSSFCAAVQLRRQYVTKLKKERKNDRKHREE